ncbi:hypothetical protein OXX69_004519 [Metschnikowia pulcherrima]
MMYTIAILATVVVSMSIEHPLKSETVLANKFRPVSSGPFVQDAQVSNNEWFKRIPLIGKGPNGCDFSDMDIASLYHLRLVEAHPKYLACQRGSAKAGAKPQLSRNMKRDVEVEIAREEKANKEATMTKVAELTKQFENLKASLPAASHGKIEDLESYEPVRRRFKALLSKMRLLDIRYDQVTDLKKGIEEFSQTIDNYNDMANDMCSMTGKASSCVHFSRPVYHNELLEVQKRYNVLYEDMNTNKEGRTYELLQSYRSRFNALRARYIVISDVDVNQWSSFRSYYNTVLDRISHKDFEVNQILSSWEA